MVNAAASNYLNNVNSVYRYNHSAMRSTTSQYNTAEVKSAQKKSYINNDALKYVASIQANAKNMMESLDALGNQDTFSKMQAVSSNSKNLEISQKSDVDVGFKYMQVDVKQVASNQVNEGTALKSDEKPASDTGIKQFELEQNGRRYQFSVSVRNNDTNGSVQQKMADAINARNIGVTANVNRDDRSGTSALSIQSNNTGTGNRGSFTVRDVDGDLAARTGAGNVAREARDAIYSVNGGANRVSGTNEVNLGEGVVARFNNASSGAVRITAQRDTNEAVNAAKDLVNSFNGLVNVTSGSRDGTKIQSDLLNAAQTYSASLERAGITANKDGTLSVDDDALGKAAENGSLEQLLTPTQNSSNYGFADRLTQIAQRSDYNSSEAGQQNAAVSSRNNTESTANGYRQSMNNSNYLYSYIFGSGNSAGALFNLYA